MTGETGGKAPSLALYRNFIHFYGLGLLFVMLLFSLFAVWLDGQSVAQQERAFNEQQAVQVLSAKQALEDHLRVLFTEIEILVSNSQLDFYEGGEDTALMCELFSETQDAYPEVLAYSFFAASDRLTCMQAVQQPAGAEAEHLARMWVGESWPTLAAGGSDLQVSPFHITPDYRMFGLLFPVWGGGAFQGVVAVVVDFDPLVRSYVAPLSAGRYGKGYLIDGQGQVVHHPNAEHIGHNIFAGVHAFSPDLNEMNRRLVEERSGTDVVDISDDQDLDALRSLIAWNTVQVGAQKLIVLISSPDLEIAETIYEMRLQRVLLGGFLFIVLLGGGGFLLYSRQQWLEQTAEALQSEVRSRTAALSTSEDRYRSLVEHAPLGIFSFDTEGAITAVNPAFLYMLGCPLAEADTARERLSLSGLTEMTFATLLQRYHEREEAIVVEHRYRGPWGRTVYLRLHVTLMKDRDGTAYGGLAMAEDVSRLRSAEATLLQRNQELAFLSRASQLFSTPLDLDAVLEAALEEVRHLLNVFAASIWLIDPENGDLVCRQATGFKGDDVCGWRLQPGDGLAGWVAMHGESLIVPDAREDHRHFLGVSQQIGQEMRSLLTVPLRVRQDIIGVLQVVDEEVDCFKPDDLLLLEPLAATVSIAVENARLFERELAQRVLSEALSEAAAVVNSTLDLEQVFDRILEQAERVVAGDAFNIMVVEGEGVRAVRWRGYDRLGVEELIARFASSFVPYHNLTVMLQTGDPVVVADIASDPDWVLLDGWELLHSYVGAPIKVAGEVLGFLNVDGTRVGQFSDRDARRLQALASHAALAVEHARLFASAHQRVKELEVLQRTSLQITATLELSEVLDSIAENALSLVPASDCHIYLYDEATQTFTFGTALWEGGRKTPASSAPRKDGLTAHVARGGEPIIIDNAPAHPFYADPKVRGWGLQAIAAFPLKRAGHVLGVFTIAFLEPHTFTQDELRILTLLADQSVIAIENARLYRQLHDYAETLEVRVQERTAEIAAQYAQLEAILESTADGILVTNVQGEIILANPVVSELLSQTLSPEDAARLRETVHDLVQRADAYPVALLTFTGLDLELKAAPTTVPEEPLVVVAVHDVSHLKALDRVKTNFVTNVSHELRTPAATIKLYVELLQRGSQDKFDAYLSALSKESARQAKLVEDILHISRIDAGRLELQLMPTRLVALTSDVVSRHQVLAQERGVTLVHVPADSGIIVMADLDQMVMVFNNLVRNALHYTPSGGQITVTVARETREGQPWASVRVSDTGMGIPEKELPHVFERFFRGEQPQSLQISGTGLGLAIVKQIVELHGGYVTVESQMGEGSTFTVWFRIVN